MLLENPPDVEMEASPYRQLQQLLLRSSGVSDSSMHLRRMLGATLAAYTASPSREWWQQVRALIGADTERKNALYEQDFYAWTQEQAKVLAGHKWEALDVLHLVEELALMAGNERRALGSYLQSLLLHLLKWQYQPQGRQMGHSWEDSIVHAREQIHDMLEDSHALRRHLKPLFLRHYPRARREARRETGLPIATFPEACPWTLAQVLDDDFWPEEEASR